MASMGCWSSSDRFGSILEQFWPIPGQRCSSSADVGPDVGRGRNGGVDTILLGSHVFARKRPARCVCVCVFAKIGAGVAELLSTRSFGRICRRPSDGAPRALLNFRGRPHVGAPWAGCPLPFGFGEHFWRTRSLCCMIGTLDVLGHARAQRRQGRISRTGVLFHWSGRGAQPCHSAPWRPFGQGDAEARGRAPQWKGRGVKCPVPDSQESVGSAPPQ